MVRRDPVELAVNLGNGRKWRSLRCKGDSVDEGSQVLFPPKGEVIIGRQVRETKRAVPLGRRLSSNGSCPSRSVPGTDDPRPLDLGGDTDPEV
jgi:hypothetical protein